MDLVDQFFGRVALSDMIRNDIFEAYKTLQVLYPLDDCLWIDRSHFEQTGINLCENLIVFAQIELVDALAIQIRHWERFFFRYL